MFKFSLNKNVNLKGERNYLHSTNIVKSLEFISNFFKINKIQFNNYMKSKPKIYIAKVDNYKKSENCSIEIEIENRNKYIIYIKPSNKAISKNISYSEKINDYILEKGKIIFGKSDHLETFESIIAGNKILCNNIYQSEANWAAVRVSFKNFYLLRKEFKEISISNVKVLQDLWFESIVLIDDEVLCNILFKKE